MQATDFNRYPDYVDRVLDGYEQLVERRVEDGWRPYLMTMMFAHLSGRQAGVLAQMFDEADRVYRTFVPNFLVARRNLSRRSIDELPLLVVAPDFPVGKSGKPLADVAINDGLHLHGVLVAPPRSRLPVPVDEHFRTEQALYVRDRSRLRTLDVRPITETVGVAVGYALKSLRRRRFSMDELLILPRGTAELRSR